MKAAVFVEPGRIELAERPIPDIRLMNVIAAKRADLRPLVTHRFALDDIVDAYELFAHQRDGVLKVAITP